MTIFDQDNSAILDETGDAILDQDGAQASTTELLSDSWLKKRLTPVKRATSIWSELAESLQEFWEELFYPEIQRLKDANSVFSARADDLVTIMTELGDYFRYDIGDAADRPLHAVWRRLELEDKESSSLFSQAIRRKFMGMVTDWIPVYHLRTAEYGTAYKDAYEIERDGSDISDYFLTSRGKLMIRSDSILDFPLTVAEIYAATAIELERILPTHITFVATKLVTEVESDLAIAIIPRICVHVTVGESVNDLDFTINITQATVTVISMNLQILAE